MNDCIWSWIMICECENGRCDRYLSVNSQEGNEIKNQYDKDVQEALVPVREKYKERFL